MIAVITGAGGFIGANFVRYFLQKGYGVVAIDSFRHKGTFSRLNKAVDGIKLEGGFWHFRHDLNAPIDSVLANELEHICFGENAVFINCASNSAVNRSITDPRECWENNCAIAVNVLEYLRTSPRTLYDAIIQLSTDEVYGDYTISSGKGFKEWSSINPSNPYAASKAAQEALFISYWRTYQMPIILANTMNNIGEWQDNEKFIPLVVSRLHKKQNIQVYADADGNPGSRVYLDVQDHAHMMHELCWRSMQNSSFVKTFPVDDLPHRFNLCGKEEVDNLEMVLMIGEVMGMSREEVMPYVKIVPPAVARPGYDKRYLLDATKFESTFNFAHTELKQTLQRIVSFTLKNRTWME